MIPPSSTGSKSPKNYLLDTNVLLHDPHSLFHFEDNTVWIPAEVLEELDKFKTENSTRGTNAREVHRKLIERFPDHDAMKDGVSLENGGRLCVSVNPKLIWNSGHLEIVGHTKVDKTVRAVLTDFSSTDNRILAHAAYLSATLKAPTVLVTKDLNMQLKARALDIEVQDYRTDRVDDDDIRRTQRRNSVDECDTVDVEPYALQAFSTQNKLILDAVRHLPVNAYLLVRNEEEHTHAMAARHVGNGELRRLRTDHFNVRGGRTISALNLGQRFLLDALFDPEISLVTVYGKAGTGKTLLTVGGGLAQVQDGLYEKMLITRVIMPTGRDIGFLPGRTEEKMAPWVQPALDALDLVLSRPRKPESFENKRQSRRKTPAREVAEPPQPPSHATNGNKPQRTYELLMQAGIIEIEAITHIRGRSLPASFFIVDEAQQLTPHEAKTLVTRMARGSKIVLIGDLAQIDNPYVDAHTNGLVYTRNRLQGQKFMAHVNLFKGERSEMAEVAANLM